MSKTSAELIERVLNKLKVRTPASARDTLLVKNEIRPVMDQLAKRGIYAWGDPDAIEDGAFVHVATIIANSVAADFGVKPDGLDFGANIVKRAEDLLIDLEPVVMSGQPLRAEYF